MTGRQDWGQYTFSSCSLETWSCTLFYHASSMISPDDEQLGSPDNIAQVRWYKHCHNIWHLTTPVASIIASTKAERFNLKVSCVRWSAHWIPPGRSLTEFQAWTWIRGQLGLRGHMGQKYYCDMTLSQEFKPMGVQLSLKAAQPLAGILATASDRCSKTGPRALGIGLIIGFIHGEF